MLRVPDFSLSPRKEAENEKKIEQVKSKADLENQTVESANVGSTENSDMSKSGQRGKEKLRPVSSVKAFVIIPPLVEVEIKPLKDKVEVDRFSAFSDISFEETNEDTYTLNK